MQSGLMPGVPGPRFRNCWADRFPLRIRRRNCGWGASGDPSHVIAQDGTETSLLELVDSDPIGQLGEECANRWGGRLPFLLKILAIEEPLSMQAHPSAEQAAEGWAREEAAGIPKDAPNRNYPDPTAKPELVCALTEFHALAGFRDPKRTVQLLRAIDTPGLTKYTELLAAQPDSDGLRALFTTWITMPQPTLDQLLPEVLDACVRHIKEDGEFDLECRTVLELGEAHPHDAGVLAAMLLNRLTLSAGEAIYLPAGNLHLYLHGTAVEILANSDNILRGGLTPKHVDVPELLRVVDFACGDMPVLCGEFGDVDERMAFYRTDAPEFELSRVEWSGGDREEVRLPRSDRRSCSAPRASCCCARRTAPRSSYGGGESVWLPASDPGCGYALSVAVPRTCSATPGSCA